MTEEELAGGLTNPRRVFRDGEHVVRPATAHTPSVHRFLRSLASAGFDGAPRPVGIDADGRQRLTFLAGDVPAAPYPAWAQTDAALWSIASLTRRFHLAATDFDHSVERWNPTLADPRGGPVVCHNDLELSNITFLDGVAVGFIDFEYAAPGRPLYDLAHLARLCVPIEHDHDRSRMGWATARLPARLRLIADAYGLDPSERSRFLAAIDDALAQIEVVARRALVGGDDAALAAIAVTGGIEKYDRRRSWWQQHRAQFEAALR